MFRGRGGTDGFEVPLLLVVVVAAAIVESVRGDEDSSELDSSWADAAKFTKEKIFR